MLAYFHYAYNGAALLSAPLDKSHEDMPKEQVAYIRAIQEEVARQGKISSSLSKHHSICFMSRKEQSLLLLKLMTLTIQGII